ncbi:hypothetical protein JVU11DRAFT_5178 [Chiua virens]|nr:hypothetical protein JVU11DRAFT_5178 [Chiua virens]
MYPLPAHTVQLILQYISPLSDPFPPHLISTPLRQRHYFLQLSPSSAVEYLGWPSPQSAKIIDLFDRLPPLLDQASYPTCYTSDPESTFAHVQISSNLEGLRMLFHWDDIRGWTYHDLQLMPFPPSSFSTPQESLASISACGQDPTQPPPINLADQVDDDGDDSYWDAYGTAGDDLPSPLPPQSASKSDTVEGEDAYWAQYASVQGTADSTIPSPLPISRKLQPVGSNDQESVFQFRNQKDPIIDVPVNVLHSRPIASGLGPPSPICLCIFSARTDLSSEQTTADSELVTPPLTTGYLDASIISPIAIKIDDAPLSKYHSRHLHETEDKALTDSIKGLYYLWKSGRKGELDIKDRSVFLQIVQAAIPHE